MEKTSALTDKIQKDIIRRDNAGLTFKVGDCVANEYGKEFDETPSVFEVKIVRIEKVGRDSVLIKKVFDFRKEEHSFVKKFTDLEALPPQEEYKIIVDNGIKIPCKKVDELLVSMRSAAEVMDRANALGGKLATLKQIVAAQ